MTVKASASIACGQGESLAGYRVGPKADPQQTAGNEAEVVSVGVL